MARPKTFIIAEAGVNHNGSVDLARRLIDEAAAAGADAVKFQAFRAEKLVSARAPKADYQRVTTAEGESQHAMLERLQLAPRDFADLAAHARARGIEFMSTPFDEESLGLLVELGVGRLKLGSGDITHRPLLEAAARTALPLILSSGMSTLGDIEDALGVLASTYLAKALRPRDALSSDEGHAALVSRVSLLHCTTEYPAPIEETNLRAIETLARAFGLPVGYSDHTDGLVASIAAVALGASIIEKHFTTDKALPGPDHRASLAPAELGELVRSIRAVELALGDTRKRVGSAERRNVDAARRSIVARVPIAAGTRFVADMLAMKRPGGGLSPMRVEELIGHIATRDYAVDDAIEL
ncbi:MAG: N-acetylneuraminate synthase [Labilithrix sp.]|nr:N-acetylneuraminate synthase [Labilithrix sp.]MCW5814736.1 N-acetylneuraminate synthase [Labilithrix sp.]